MPTITQLQAQRLLRDSEAFYFFAEAYPLALFGDSKRAIETCNVALALGPSYNMRGFVAFAQALAGENKRPLELMALNVHERPDDTLVQAVYGPLVILEAGLFV